MNVFKVSVVHRDGDGYATFELVGIWKDLKTAELDNRNLLEAKLAGWNKRKLHNLIKKVKSNRKHHYSFWIKEML